ncbi:hypothetical protein LPJ72_006360, partial [Coemansia sp. Benny D160-2]
MAEVMAIFMAIVLADIAPPRRLVIKTDSQAAIGAMEALKRRDPKRPWRSSPMAALLEWGAVWFEEYWDRLSFVWVKGHAGNQYNEGADRLAREGHEEQHRVWSLKLGAPPTVQWWACWNNQPATGKPGNLIKKIERAAVKERLLTQVRVAHPQEWIEQEDLDDVLTALSWFREGEGRFQAKRSYKKTSERDSSERSLGIKLLLGNVPVM